MKIAQQTTTAAVQIVIFITRLRVACFKEVVGMDIGKKLSEILAILQNEERSVEVSGDKESLRVYFEEGTSLGFVNLVVGVLKEVIDIEEHELTLHKDEDSGRIYLLWLWEEGES